MILRFVILLLMSAGFLQSPSTHARNKIQYRKNYHKKKRPFNSKTRIVKGKTQYLKRAKIEKPSGIPFPVYHKRFYPHMSEAARTIGHFNLSYDIFPGANGYNKWYMNSINVGLSDFFQFGTVPLFYLREDAKYNYNLKLNFLRLRQLHLAFGYSKFVFKLPALHVTERDGSVTKVSAIDVDYVSFIINFLPRYSVLTYALSISTFSLHTDSTRLNQELEKIDYPIEWFFEISHYLTKKFWLTLGYGAQRTDSFKMDSKSLPRGYGATLTWLRPFNIRYLQRVSAGLHYIPQVHRLLALFSLSP